MKRIFNLALFALAASQPVLAQETKKEEKIRIHIAQEKGGRKTVTDTVFDSQEAADRYMKQNNITAPVPPVAPTPPVPPVAGTPRSPRTPKTPPAPPKIRKEIRISKGESPENEHTLAYAFSDEEDSLTETAMRKLRHFEFDIERGIPEDFPMRNPANNYRLDFNLDEPGTAKITVQKDGKMLYEESLEEVSGRFHRDFDRNRYEGATLQLTVKSSKSTQNRKMVL